MRQSQQLLNLTQIKHKKSYEKHYIDNVQMDENGYYIVDDMHLDKYQYQVLTRGLFRTPCCMLTS